MNKSTREFYFKNKQIRDFLYGIDKRDERFVFSSLGLIDLETGSKVIKAGTREQSLLIVANGELIAFRETESVVFPVGSILGIEQFLFNTPWPEDIVVSQGCRLAKLKHESMGELVSTNALAAIKL